MVAEGVSDGVVDSGSLPKVAGRKAGFSASDDGLKVVGRKKGDLVPRKIVMKDGTKLEILIDERHMTNIMVNQMELIYYEDACKRILQADPLYLKAEGYLTGNPNMRYYLIDMHDLRFIRGIGEQYLCLAKVMPSELKRIPNVDSWHKTSTFVYKVEPSVNLLDFFRRHNWKDFLRLWITENLDKDPRLLDSFMTNILPLIPENWENDSEISKLQFFNNHMFWITSTKSGKSEFAKIMGITPSSDWSIAGLFGGTVSNGKTSERVFGTLEGYGMHMFDECMYMKSYDDKNILSSILGYMQQGTAMRELKMVTKCKGTKSLIFSSNPTTGKDMTTSFCKFLSSLAGEDYPDKIGSRIGSFILGETKQLMPIGAISSFRGVGYRIIDQVLRKFYFTRIYPLLKTNMEWACETKEYRNAYLRFSDASANEMIQDFIKGCSLSIPKLKMGAIRLLILQNLGDIVIGFNRSKFQKDIIQKNREQAFLQLISANMQSLALLSHANDSLGPEKNSCIKLREKFPKMSVRDIGSVIGVSKSTAARWLKEENLLTEAEEAESISGDENICL